MNVSVVISTLDRCETLRKTLLSLSQQRYRDFEVIVVNGPSTDGTDQLLAQWHDRIKVGRCPVANLSVSRNIGIAMAAGDIVAFIDDDAIPHPCWIERIVDGYDRPDIGAVGGFVFDNTGFSFQTTYIVADRFGMADTHYPFDPIDAFNTPGGFRYAAHLGTNTSVLRSLLVRLGGFDEEFEYYLDETDLCARIVDSGYIVKIVPEALVYHKFAASHIRNSEKVLLRRYPVIKNQAYFAVKHGRGIRGFQAARDSSDRFVEDHRRQVLDLVKRAVIPANSIEIFEMEASRAVTDGTARALARTEAVESSGSLFPKPAAFKRYRHRNIASDRLTLCFLAETEDAGAVAEVAARIATLGHTVHLLSPSSCGNLVDFDDGVWSHRVAVRQAAHYLSEVPASLWDRSETLAGEVNRIAKSDRIDVIYVPTNGCLATGVLAETSIPVVATIQQPIAARVLAQPPDFYSFVGTVVAELWWERQTIIFADGLCVPDIETLQYLEREHGVVVDRSRLVLHSPGHLDPVSDVELVSLFQKLRCSDNQLARRVLRSSAAPTFSRQCRVGEFWFGSPLYSWLRGFSAGRVDWRLWAYCNMLKEMANVSSRPVLILTDEIHPYAITPARSPEISQVTDATVTTAIENARYEHGKAEFAAVFCHLLVDLRDKECVDILIQLAELCCPGGPIYITAAVGGTAEWHLALRDRLKKSGIDAEFDPELLGGAPEPRRYSDIRMEPYIYPEINGTPSVVAVLRFRRNKPCA